MPPDNSRRRPTRLYPAEAPQADRVVLVFLLITALYLAAAFACSWYIVLWYAPETQHFVFAMGLSVAALLVIGAVVVFAYVLYRIYQRPPV